MAKKDFWVENVKVTLVAAEWNNITIILGLVEPNSSYIEFRLSCSGSVFVYDICSGARLPAAASNETSPAPA